MQRLLGPLQQHAPMPMHDRLGIARGPRGIDDPNRMRKRHRDEGGHLRRRLHHGPIGPAFGQIEQRRHHHPMRQRGQTRRDPLQHRAPVHPLARMDIAILRDQHLGFDLPETVQYRHMPHIRRTERPHRPQRGGGKKGHQGLDRIGQHRNHPVTLPHPHVPQRCLRRAHARVQLAPCDLVPPEGFGLQDHRHIIRPRHRMAQHLAREIRLGPGKPLRAGHFPLRQDLGPPRYGQIEKPYDRRPEPLQIRDRPIPQCVIIRKLQPALGCQPADELRQC